MVKTQGTGNKARIFWGKGLKHKANQAAVAYSCNPSYSGGRAQEDQGLKPAWANSLRDSVFKKKNHKKRLVEWLKV
jgi:hypothetical protein